MKAFMTKLLAMVACLSFLVSCTNRDDPLKAVKPAQSTNSAAIDIDTQLHRIGAEYGIFSISIDHANHIITISMDDLPGVYEKATNSIHKVLGNDFTNYNIVVIEP